MLYIEATFFLYDGERNVLHDEMEVLSALGICADHWLMASLSQ